MLVISEVGRLLLLQALPISHTRMAGLVSLAIDRDPTILDRAALDISTYAKPIGVVSGTQGTAQLPTNPGRVRTGQPEHSEVVCRFIFAALSLSPHSNISGARRNSIFH
jgi:hypothetical protein